MTTHEKTNRRLYLQVLVAIGLGAAVGVVRPELGAALKPGGDVFLSLVKLVIAPIVFCTVTHGIAAMGDLGRVGRVGVKALVYFELMTTVALALGLAVVHLVRPGDGLHARAAELQTSTGAVSAPHGAAEHLQSIIPSSVVGAFAGGSVLQVLFLAVLVGVALASMGEAGKPAVAAIDAVAKVCFRVTSMVMRAAPLGAFASMAYTVGKFGFGSLGNLAALIGAFYLTALLFVLVVLGGVCRLCGFSITRLLRYLREELLVVLGTASSEAVLPQVMEKLEAAGCGAATVRLVVPTGFSFNLDGSCIYLTMAAVFVAQALDVPLTLGDEVSLLVLLLLASKGAAAVSGSAFVTLSATLASFGAIPTGGVSLLLGVDRFMSEARALTNLVGNAVGTIAVAKWEGSLDLAALRRALGEADAPVAVPMAVD